MKTSVFCGRHLITTIFMLIIISFPIMSTSELSDNSQKPLVLRGTDEPKSTLLMHNLKKNLVEEKKNKEEADIEKAEIEEIEMVYKFGEGSSEEKIHKIFEENVRKIFGNSKWIFFDKKSFIFGSSQFNADGDYSITDNVFEFHGQSIAGAIFTLDGFIRPQKDSFVLDAIYTVSLKGRQQVGRVSQILHQEVQVPSAPTPPEKPVEIEGIPVPSSYKIELTGTTDGQEFGPLVASLDISPSQPGDPNPFQIMFTSHPLNAIGHTSWFSVIPPREKDKGLSSEIIIKPGPEVELKLKSDTKSGWAATWDTVDKDLKIPGINATAGVRNGTLTFSIQGDRITGEIHATGESWHGRSSDYQARFTGQRQGPGSMSAERTDDERLREYTPLSIGKTVDIGGVPVSSVFEVELTGKTEAQSFGPLSAKVLINESEPGDSNPFSIRLLTQGPSKNGWLAWNSFELDESHQEVEPTSIINAQDGKVRMELKPGTFSMNHGLFWFTLEKKESSPDDTTMVYPEKATLEFSVQGDHISGTISASGLLGSDFKQSGTYEAELVGSRQESKPVKELQQIFGVSKFDGVWDTDLPFKQITLQGYQQKLSGIFSGLPGGTLESTVGSNSLNEENYLNFTWHSKTDQQGWGFLRALPAGGTLAGLWGYGIDRTESQVLIATQQPLSPETQSIETPHDLQQLRDLGIDLAGQGKCEQAVKVLEKAWKIYHEKRPQKETTHLEKADYLLGEAKVLEPLTNCYSKLGNYDEIVKYLVYAVEVRSLLGPKESAKQLFEQRVGTMVPDLKSNANRFKILQENLPNLNKGRIGIDFEQDEKTRKIVVTAVTKDAPAYAAGIQPQDIIVGIDGHSIEGIDLKDISDRIGGPEGTQVHLTIVRGDKQMDFVPTRQRLRLPVSAAREAEINNLIGFFSNYLENLQTSLTSSAERLTALEDEINKDRKDPVQELLALKDQLANQSIQVNTKRNEIIASGEKFFKDQQELLQDSRELIHFGSSKNFAETSKIDPREIEAMENRMMESLEKNHDLSWAEKILFKEYYHNELFLDILSFELDIWSNFIKKLQVGENFDVRTEQTREAALRLSNSIEDWRNQLKTDMGKIAALSKGQPFFRSLVKLLWNMDSTKEALEASPLKVNHNLLI